MSWVVVVLPQEDERGRRFGWRAYVTDDLDTQILQPLWAKASTARGAAEAGLREVRTSTYMQGGQWRAAPPVVGVYRISTGCEPVQMGGVL